LELRERPPSTLRNVDGGPREVSERNARERPPSTLRNIDGRPRKVPELKVREQPPSTLRDVDDGPPRRAGAGDSRAPTINAKTRR
jgi:hypothetical protein